ncbi:hypothetical protein ACLOJK_036451 [Asimina triloba]
MAAGYQPSSSSSTAAATPISDDKLHLPKFDDKIRRKPNLVGHDADHQNQISSVNDLKPQNAASNLKSSDGPHNQTDSNNFSGDGRPNSRWVETHFVQHGDGVLISIKGSYGRCSRQIQINVIHGPTSKSRNISNISGSAVSGAPLATRPIQQPQIEQQHEGWRLHHHSTQMRAAKWPKCADL